MFVHDQVCRFFVIVSKLASKLILLFPKEIFTINMNAIQINVHIFIALTDEEMQINLILSSSQRNEVNTGADDYFRDLSSPNDGAGIYLS